MNSPITEVIHALLDRMDRIRKEKDERIAYYEHRAQESAENLSTLIRDTDEELDALRTAISEADDVLTKALAVTDVVAPIATRVMALVAKLNELERRLESTETTLQKVEEVLDHADPDAPIELPLEVRLTNLLSRRDAVTDGLRTEIERLKTQPNDRHELRDQRDRLLEIRMACLLICGQYRDPHHVRIDRIRAELEKFVVQ